ncbi:DNA gyrase subunit A [Candidatus Berkelbacteria bacterium CG10_big_fil_rev_8_21_14_0_10_41_12]|uniref:DNA gyrase subunit A n=1 Tax=Candidatus Berkelbacteria bacterium CG10_big_fil_rev_8_21_14_0_10_41_12 TaxID=1974513 RepID=A0A2M6WXZ7_9BACT|nr:MAG: DNA gyrase subunit A [Candidatus Berkelbacteria bacterium CG10_big_fil_rev_8_21_14_0_10_41_12]
MEEKKEIKQEPLSNNNEPEVKNIVGVGKVIERSITQEMEQSYLDYAMSVIVARALPDARDGLKPVHRKILFTMGEMNLYSSSKSTKSAKIVGEVMGKYHPHGDTAIYDTLVRMAQDFSMSVPLVKGQGNFGSIDGDPPAAMRYTEAKLTAPSGEMLSDIDKKTVKYIDNYDGTLKEPSVLPSKLPNLLLNGAVGIAVGMATNIPPHNLSELCDGIIHLIDNPQSTTDDLMEFIKGPDLPTNGEIHGAEGIRNAYTTGKGKIIIRGQANIEESKRGLRIVISSIPYQVNKSDLITKIADLVKGKKIDGITDIRDESDKKEGVRIVIELKSASYPKKVLNKLFSLTPLQSAFHVNLLALIDGIQPRILTLGSALDEYIKHRQIVVRRRIEFDLTRAKERAHILEGLKKALNHIDEIITIIKKSANREDALKNLIAKFEFSEIQANAILDMRLSALAALERQKVDDELAEKLKLIKELEAILSDEKKILSIISDELKEIKSKYGFDRRTKIIKSELDSFKAEDLIPNEKTIVTITNENYIKRVPIDTYKKQARGGKGIVGMTPKEEDSVKEMVVTNTLDTIYFFTEKGRLFSTMVYGIPQASRQAKGQAIANLIQIGQDENVTTILTDTKDKLQDKKFFIIATKRGLIKKTKIEAYKNIRKSGLIAIKLRPDDKLRFATTSSGEDQIIMVSRKGQSILFDEKDARPMQRGTSGVRGIKLRESDDLISLDILSKDDTDSDLLTILENGYGKRTNISRNHPRQHRGGSGVKAVKTTVKTGLVVEASVVEGNEGDMIICSRHGQVIRISLKSVKKLGRDTQGVRLIRLNANDKTASVIHIIKDEIIETIDSGSPPIKPDNDEKHNKQSPSLHIRYYKDEK